MSRYPETEDQRQFKVEIGKRLRAVRLNKGIPLTTMGEATGMGAGNMSGYESGKKGLTAWTLVKFAEALGVEAGEFLP
jgi:transcriptional regulator with XRE-family HTH domain